MDKFVELCLNQYWAEREKQKLIGKSSDSAIDSFKTDCVGRQVLDILHYSKSPEQFEKLSTEFKQVILSETK